MAKYNLMQMTKALEKLFNAGYKDEKSILSLQLEDLEKLQDINVLELSIIINLKKAIKSKQIIKFLSSDE